VTARLLEARSGRASPRPSAPSSARALTVLSVLTPPGAGQFGDGAHPPAVGGAEEAAAGVGEAAQRGGGLVARHSRTYTHAHPATAPLVIEASDASLWYDRRKGSLYARAGVAGYWIVNLRDNVLEVRRRPVPDASAHYGHGYADLTTLRAGDAVAPLAAPQATVAVADLLP
jgi:hypothetical protein